MLRIRNDFFSDPEPNLQLVSDPYPDPDPDSDPVLAHTCYSLHKFYFCIPFLCVSLHIVMKYMVTFLRKFLLYLYF